MPGRFRSFSSRDSAVRAVRRWLTGTFSGRVLLTAALIKLAAAVLRRVAPGPSIVETIDTVGDLALVVGAIALAYRLFSEVRGVMLWRVRSKLTISYIFIGFVPVLLLIILSLTAGAVLFFNVSQYVAGKGVTSIVDQARFLAESAAVGLETSNPAELHERLQRRQVGAMRALPLVSYALVPATRTCRSASDAGASVAITKPITAGPWQHLDPPKAIPEWVSCGGSAGLIAYRDSSTRDAADHGYLAARAIAWPDDAEPRFAVVVDVPFTEVLDERLQRDIDIEVGDVSLVFDDGCEDSAMSGHTPPGPRTQASRFDGGSRNPLKRSFGWVTILKYFDWRTGRPCDAMMSIRTTMADVWTLISPTRVGSRDFGTVLLVIMGLVGSLLFVIQFAAFLVGLTLARSITGAVHELFAGTERVRQGNFTHKIPIRSRDQLGDLADSFNSMTSSIEDLLQEKAEKERMEQELRIARNIQMSLLPQGRLKLAGLALDAHCEPAREVGGDYYDYLPIDDHRVGLLIADVAGKGTSAALYMAELKGLMLSLSQLHTSPRRLLIDANRIISKHLDTRSFITITYAVVDMQARTLTYARAGHTPLIYVPGPQSSSRAAQILAPDGLVLGLQIDDGQRFNELLQEATVSLGAGDLFLFYTDGLTEAMDEEGNCFGDARLSALLREHADLPFDQLRERILREIAVFSGSVDQQDDMTMLLLKVEASSVPATAGSFASSAQAGSRA